MVQTNSTYSRSIDATYNLLRSSISRVTPVVVSIDGMKDRFASFTDRVFKQNGVLSLALQPIEPQALEKIKQSSHSNIFVKSSDDEQPWAIRAQSIKVQASKRTAYIGLNDILEFRTLPKRIARLQSCAQNSLVVIVTSGTGMANTSTFPLIDLSKDVCCIESENSWRIGEKIPRIDIVGSGNRRLRTVSAQVVDSFPWHPANGTSRFRCRLSISPFRGENDFKGEPISSKQVINQILNLAVLEQCKGVLKDTYGESSPVQFKKTDTTSLHIHLENNFNHLNLQAPLSLQFELYNSFYVFSFSIDEYDQLLNLQIPDTLQILHRRWLPRVEVPQGKSIDFIFSTAEQPMEASRKVIDLSVGGLSFESNPHQDVLWPNLRLQNCRIRCGEDLFPLGEYEVKEVLHTSGKSICHAVYQSGPKSAIKELAQRVIQLRYPYIDSYTEKDFSQLLQISEESGILHDHMKINLPKETAINWSKLAQSKGELGTIFLHKNKEENRIDGSITALRTWNHTIVAQHLIALGPQKSNLAAQLRQICLENTLVLNQIGYLLFFVKDGKNSSTFHYDYFIDTMQNHASAEHCKIHLWIASPKFPLENNLPYAHAHYSFSPIEKKHENLIQNAAEREFGALIAHALSLEKGEIDLSNVSNLYEKSGLERSRTAHLTFREEIPVCAILNERMSLGLNLTWLINSFWLLPIVRPNEDNHEDVTRSIEYILYNFPTQAPSGEYFIVTPKDQWIATDSIKSFNIRHEMTIHCYTLNLTGVSRLYDSLVQNLGSVSKVS